MPNWVREKTEQIISVYTSTAHEHGGISHVTLRFNSDLIQLSYFFKRGTFH